jgi:hypothetical protein
MVTRKLALFVDWITHSAPEHAGTAFGLYPPARRGRKPRASDRQLLSNVIHTYSARVPYLEFSMSHAKRTLTRNTALHPEPVKPEITLADEEVSDVSLATFRV